MCASHHIDNAGSKKSNEPKNLICSGKDLEQFKKCELVAFFKARGVIATGILKQLLAFAISTFQQVSFPMNLHYVNLPLWEVEYAQCSHMWCSPWLWTLQLCALNLISLPVWYSPSPHLNNSVLWTLFEVPSEMTPMERPFVVLYMELVAEFLQQGAFSRNSGNLT